MCQAQDEVGVDIEVEVVVGVEVGLRLRTLVLSLLSRVGGWVGGRKIGE